MRFSYKYKVTLVQNTTIYKLDNSKMELWLCSSWKNNIPYGIWSYIL